MLMCVCVRVCVCVCVCVCVKVIGLLNSLTESASSFASCCVRLCAQNVFPSRLLITLQNCQHCRLMLLFVKRWSNASQTMANASQTMANAFRLVLANASQTMANAS